MAVGLVVLGAILNIFVSQNRTNAEQQEVAYAQQNVRAAMGLMVRDIRNAGYDPTDIGSLIPTTETSASSIRVQFDLDGNGTIGSGEDVTYTIDNTDHQLERNGDRMIEDVVPNSLQFTYYRADGSSFVPADQDDCDDIRTVALQFQVHTENEVRNFKDGYNLYGSLEDTCRVRTLPTRVRIRNMGFQDIE